MNRLSFGVVYGSTSISYYAHLMKMRATCEEFGWWWSKLPGNFLLCFVKFQETWRRRTVRGTDSSVIWIWLTLVAWVGSETHQEFRPRYGCTASLKTAKASSTHRQDRTHQIVLTFNFSACSVAYGFIRFHSRPRIIEIIKDIIRGSESGSETTCNKISS